MMLKQVVTGMDDITIRDRNNNSDDVTNHGATGDERAENGSRLFSIVNKSKV